MDTAAAQLTEHDRFVIAEARRIAPALSGGGDREREAAELLRQLAGLAERLAG